MTTKNRWNSQRFIERVPEAELESKMALFRKDFNRFERDHRMEMAQLWQVLFRNDCELKNSIATRYSLDDVMSGGAPLAALKKTEKPPQPTAPTEADRQFEAFKTQTAALLRVSVNGRAWTERHRPNYDDLKRVDQRPTAHAINTFNVSRLFDETYLDQLHRMSEKDDLDGSNDKWFIRNSYCISPNARGEAGVSLTGSTSLAVSRGSSTVSQGGISLKRKQSKKTSPVSEVGGSRRVAVSGRMASVEFDDDLRVIGSRQRISERFVDNIGATGSTLKSKRWQTSLDEESNLPSIVETAIDVDAGNSTDNVATSETDVRLPNIVQQS